MKQSDKDRRWSRRQQLIRTMASRADGMETLAASAVIDAERKAFTEAAAALREEAGRVRAGREWLRRLQLAPP